ncbi:MAG TPA: MCE family protein [Nocardioides sp.]|nr:MCE family protein [Nocardioides sp.]
MTSSPRSSWLRRRTSALLVGLVSAALVLSGCSVYDAPLPGGAKTGDNPMTIKVMFRDVLDLVPQSTVRVNDVTVGKVTAVDLKGYVAEVTVEIPGDVKLPDNARAEIRQTSLLGEKFVQLSEPRDPGTGKLADKDVIGLDRTGRNPEVEEVLGALSLLLNGGGVGQLKTIFSELNNAMEGREPQVRSVLTQLRSFMGQLDANKASIVAAIENTNRLALEIRRNDGAIKSALDDIPDALRSVDSQRADLVKLLEALERLSGVGVRVIRASKESTINSLRHLGPVLEGFAKAGDNFAKSFQVFLTYPFIDEAVGRDPQVARNLHMGDYTNLSVNLDIDVANLPNGPGVPIPAEICKAVRDARAQVRRQIDRTPGLTPAQKRAAKDVALAQIEDDECTITPNSIQQAIAQGLASLGAAVVEGLCPGAGPAVCELLENPATLPAPKAPTGGGLPGVNLPRSNLNSAYQKPQPIDPFGLAVRGFDPGLGTMLLQGVAEVR